jgi:hypothetical protein
MLWKIIHPYEGETILFKTESKRKAYIYAIEYYNKSYIHQKVDLDDPKLNPLSEYKLERIVKSLQPATRISYGIFVEQVADDEIIDLDAPRTTST